MLIRYTITLALLCAATCSIAEEGNPGPFLDADQVKWKVNAFDVARWKTLVGGIEGGQIDSQDVQFGLWELAPKAIYHGHKHPAPEIYFILSGRAQWRVGEVTREVTSGTTIYTRPGEVHKMVNLTDQPVRAIWMWWAPGGDSEVFKGAYEFTEPTPVQPPQAKFDEDAQRKY
ncbi:MAG: cupin domain-containing protein [Pseudomonadota bacterium]